MARRVIPSTPTMQLVLRGEACQIRERLDRSRIAYEVLDQPGPLTMRVAAADWHPIRAIATERGYSRPDFFAQTDAGGKDPFRLYWLWNMPAGRP